MTIHICKDHARKTIYVDFEDLNKDQVDTLLTIANAKSRATVSGIEFPGEDSKVISFSKLVECRRFFAKKGTGSRDLLNPRVLAFKIVGKPVCDKIAHDKQAEIDEERQELNKKEQDREAKATAEGQEYKTGAFRNESAHAALDERQKQLDSFKLASSVL